jgi:D-alanyl-D-alanine carboxypeptidase/D-alanyl-D-alanine-endopeptidase (penicillin-binding protein 4)
VVLVSAVVLVLAIGAALYTVVLPERGDHGPSGPPVPVLRLSAPPAAAPVLGDASGSTTTAATFARLHAAVAPYLAKDALGGIGFAMRSLSDPSLAWSTGAPRVMPASTLKLLTTTAALQTLGPEHRFVTSVAATGPSAQPGRSPASLVLVGGGDPLLAAATPSPAEAAGGYPAPASLQELASRTATRLLGQGVTRIRLHYDDSLFAGPAVNPHWPNTYVPENVVSPIDALWVDEGRERSGLAQRSADPAASATQDFAGFLRRDGLVVVGGVQRSTTAFHGSVPAAGLVASVASAPLREIVQHILELSDNEGAEVLLRQVALATGHPGSSAAGVGAVLATLTHLGLSVSGATVYDGSGLSRDDRVPVALLLAVLGLDSSAAHPNLRAVVTGLPVAGFSGSLSYRFVADAPAGDGYVRAKTGTLTGVDGLAGIAQSRTTGAAVLFVAVADQVPVPSTLDARGDLDAIGAVLAR